MNRLAIRPAPVRGAHRRTPEAWQKAMEDLDGAARSLAELDEALDGARGELARVQAELVEERRLRGLQDALIGRVAQERDEERARALGYYGQLQRGESAQRTAVEVIADLRGRLSGAIPAQETRAS